MRAFDRAQGDATVELAEETFVMMPERALYWPARRTLLVADLHWGKAAAFRAAGVAVPTGTMRDDLARVTRALRRTHAKRLIVLGDLLHAREGRAEGVLKAVGGWRRQNRALDILLVRGNHDVRAGDPAEAWRMSVVDEPHNEPPFVFCHHPTECEAGYTLAGHVHPAVTLHDAAGLAMQLPCFHFGATSGLLPAFGSFTGSVSLRPKPGDRVFVLADGEVLRVV